MDPSWLRSPARALSNAASYTTKWTLPLQHVSEMVAFFIFIVFIIENQHFPLRSPLAYTMNLRGTPKIVFGHNWLYMALFDFSRAGFCMVFRRASFVFHARGQISEAGVGFWIPEVDILARGRFLGDLGVPKKMVLQRNDFLVRIQGDPSCPNEF